MKLIINALGETELKSQTAGLLQCYSESSDDIVDNLPISWTTPAYDFITQHIALMFKDDRQ